VQSAKGSVFPPLSLGADAAVNTLLLSVRLFTLARSSPSRSPPIITVAAKYAPAAKHMTHSAQRRERTSCIAGSPTSLAKDGAASEVAGDGADGMIASARVPTRLR